MMSFPVCCLSRKESLIMLLIDQDRAGDCDNIRKFPHHHLQYQYRRIIMTSLLDSLWKC